MSILCFLLLLTRYSPASYSSSPVTSLLPTPPHPLLPCFLLLLTRYSPASYSSSPDTPLLPGPPHLLLPCFLLLSSPVTPLCFTPLLLTPFCVLCPVSSSAYYSPITSLLPTPPLSFPPLLPTSSPVTTLLTPPAEVKFSLEPAPCLSLRWIQTGSPSL